MRSFLKIAGAAALALVVAACGEQSDGQQAAVGQKPSAVPVSVVTARAGTVQLVEAMPGRTVAYRTADVRPQVDGIITKRFFVEGAFVKAGDPLYQIDQEVYVAEVNVAKADLLRQQATLDLARKTRARYEKLRRTQAVSEQAYDDAIAAEAQAEADVAAARARLERAKIDLEYTTVRAPISGQIGASAFNEGSLVTANQSTSLATITQLDPIYVDVTQAGGRLLRIKQAILTGRVKGDVGGKLGAKLFIDATGERYPLEGTVQFSDVMVNETTGTVRLRAVFPNPDAILLPGMFVRAEVNQGTLDAAYTVPQKAVMRQPDGSAYVYVVGPENKVITKLLTIEQSQGQDWIVTSGLEDGDQIIIDGIQRVGPGAEVIPQPVTAQGSAAPQTNAG